MLQSQPNNLKNTQKAYIQIGIWAFSVFMALVMVSCDNTIEDIELVGEPTANMPISTSKNIVLDFSDSGLTKIILKSPFLERYPNSKDPYNLMPQGLEIIFMDSLGNVEATVQSNHAEHYPNKNILILTNDVRVKNLDGDRLNSERIIWNSKTKKITSEDFVKITTKNEIMYGDGLVADQDFTNYKINNIKGIVAVDDEDIQ